MHEFVQSNEWEPTQTEAPSAWHGGRGLYSPADDSRGRDRSIARGRDRSIAVARPKNETVRVVRALLTEFGPEEAVGVAERLTRGPGRPRGSVRKPQAGTVGVRLTVDERTWLRARAEEIAQREGRRVSESGVIRRLIAEARRI